jgi:hypothetical protein
MYWAQFFGSKNVDEAIQGGVDEQRMMTITQPLRT